MLIFVSEALRKRILLTCEYSLLTEKCLYHGTESPVMYKNKVLT